MAAGNTPSQIWAGTDQGALVQWNGDGWDPLLTLPSAIQVLYWVDDSLWIGAGNGLYIWNGSEAMPVTELGNVSVQSLATLANTVWSAPTRACGYANATTGRWSPRTMDCRTTVSPRCGWTSTPKCGSAPKRGIAHQELATGAWLEIYTENTEGRPFHIQALAGDSNGTVWGGMDEDGYFRIDEGGSLRLPGRFRSHHAPRPYRRRG
ncbi:MAG: hypothetical protein R2856_11040 [Caldilineaceae bacterium]